MKHSARSAGVKTAGAWKTGGGGGGKGTKKENWFWGGRGEIA